MLLPRWAVMFLLAVVLPLNTVVTTLAIVRLTGEQDRIERAIDRRTAPVQLNTAKVQALARKNSRALCIFLRVIENVEPDSPAEAQLFRETVFDLRPLITSPPKCVPPPVGG